MTNEIILPKVEMDMTSENETNRITKEAIETIEQQPSVLERPEDSDSETEALEEVQCESEPVSETETEENLEEKLVAAIEELERNLAETIRQGEKPESEEVIKEIIKDEYVEEVLEDELMEDLQVDLEEEPELDPREGKVRATPSARRIAREFKVDIQKAIGTGKNGRIEADDVKKMVVIQPGTFSYKSKEPVVIGTNLDNIDGNPRNLFSIPLKLEEIPNKKIVARKKLKDMNQKTEKLLNPELDFVPFVDENAEKFEQKDIDVVTKISELDFVPFVDIKAQPLREEIIVKPTPMNRLRETEMDNAGHKTKKSRGLRRKTTVQDENGTHVDEEKNEEKIDAQLACDPKTVEPEAFESETAEPETEPTQTEVTEIKNNKIETTPLTSEKLIEPVADDLADINQPDPVKEALVKINVETALTTLTTEIDMTEIKDLRKKITKKIEDQVKYRCTYSDFLLLATSRALIKHPLINARLENDEIINHAWVHMGLTVESDQGLMVPVIENAHGMSFAEIVKSRGDLLKTVKNRHLSPEQLRGSTFTITNLGMYGIREFTAKINQPNSAILSVGEVVQRIRVHQGEAMVRSVMKITLNLDHRVANSVEGAKFLQDIKADMENPSLLLF